VIHKIELVELEKTKEIRRGKARVTTPGDFEENKDKESFLVPGLPLPA
jgi:hypothetical protein